MADITIKDDDDIPAFTVHGEGDDQMQTIDMLTSAPMMLMTLMDILEQDALKPEAQGLRDQVLGVMNMCGYDSAQFNKTDAGSAQLNKIEIDLAQVDKN
ncbi:MAG: hypothetical protein HQL70_01485 [Magnetococcales bacterium]|nr:hypothetical protein [Magnetococcales bacterium]